MTGKMSRDIDLTVQQGYKIVKLNRLDHTLTFQIWEPIFLKQVPEVDVDLLSLLKNAFAVLYRAAPSGPRFAHP